MNQVLIMQSTGTSNFAQTLRSAFQKEGYQPILCVNGQEAQKKLDNPKLCLTVYDIGVSAGIAIGLLRMMKEKNIPASKIVLTSFPEHKKIAEMLDADWVFMKPVSIGMIISIAKYICHIKGTT